MDHDRNSSGPLPSLFFPEITIVTISNLVMHNTCQNEVTIFIISMPFLEVLSTHAVPSTWLWPVNLHHLKKQCAACLLRQILLRKSVFLGNFANFSFYFSREIKKIVH